MANDDSPPPSPPPEPDGTLSSAAPGEPAAVTRSSGTPGVPGSLGASGTSRLPRPVRPDRRALYGILIFFGLIVFCFVFALVLMRGDLGSDTAAGPRIGVVRVTGPIIDADKALTALRRFRQDKTIEAIVVRINSPGGAVAPSQELFRELRRIATEGAEDKRKPVVASLSTVAASGGYYIASGAQKIVASRGTITGSIGVISQTTNIESLLQLARIRTTTFKTGKFKDTMSPLRPMDDEEQAYMQGFVDKILAQFVDDVAAGRKLAVARVRKLADGRVFTGEEARQHGLVDVVGNFDDALRLAVELAGAEGEPVPVYHRPRGGLLQELLREPLSEVIQGAFERLRQVEQQRVEARAPRL